MIRIGLIAAGGCEGDPMFRRILVPVDGSTTSNRGLRVAIDLAHDQQATLHLLHVVDELLLTPALEGGAYFTAQQVDAYAAALRAQGGKVLAKAEAEAAKKGIACRTTLVETLGGPVADAIVAHAQKIRADLIVLGTHGRRGLKRAVMGSDAEGVVRASPVPVLLVRLGTRPKSPRAPADDAPATRRPRPPKA
jgi:nucleotide-binding universal stress UspA family protein